MANEGDIRRLKNKSMYSVRTADPKVTMLLKEDTLLEWPVGSGKGVPVSKLFQMQEKAKHAQNRPDPNGVA